MKKRKKTRYCRKCEVKLPVTRYFKCVLCMPPETEDIFDSCGSNFDISYLPVRRGVKKCKKCLKVLPKMQFNYNHTTRDKLLSTCKACYSTYNYKNYREVKERKCISTTL